MAVLLNKFEGMSYADIAPVMELSPQAVKSLLSRARSNLREVLEPYFENGERPARGNDESVREHPNVRTTGTNRSGHSRSNWWPISTASWTPRPAAASRSCSPATRRSARRCRSWTAPGELLDELDTGGVDERFTRSTLEMVAVAAADEVEKTRAEAPRRRRRRWLAIAAGAVAAGVLGFVATAMFWPDPDKKPNDRLVENLPVLENLDQYCQVEDIDFLRHAGEGAAVRGGGG